MSLSRKVLLGCVAAIVVAVGAIAGDRALLFRATFIASGTGAGERSGMEKLRDQISVKDFKGSDGINCKGDGSHDDTECIQAAIAAAATGVGNELFFPPGTYIVTNLTHGSTPWRGVPRQSIIKAKSGGDSGYMVASGRWLEAGQTLASDPWDYVTGVDFDCNGLKTYCVVLRTYFTKFENNQIKGATDTDLLMSADARDATALASTMVNNVFINNWFGVDGVTAAYNFRTIDSGCKGLDARLTNNYLSGATVANFWLVCSAGWDIFGNHTYSAPSGAYIYKPNIGTRIVENYFENPVRIGSPNGAATYAAYLGGGNYFADTVWADFDNVGNFIISHDNEYGVSAELRHAYFDPSKVVISIGDTFRSATPFKHYSSAGGAAQDASTGKFLINGSMLTPIGRLVTTQFDGSGATSSILHRPASFDLDALDARRQPMGVNVVTYSASMTPSPNLGLVQQITVTNGTAFTINVPAALAQTGQEMIVLIKNTSGGAHGLITWGTGFKTAAAALVVATANNKTVRFAYDGTNWIESFRSAADVAN